MERRGAHSVSTVTNTRAAANDRRRGDDLLNGEPLAAANGVFGAVDAALATVKEILSIV